VTNPTGNVDRQWPRARPAESFAAVVDASHEATVAFQESYRFMPRQEPPRRALRPTKAVAGPFDF